MLDVPLGEIWWCDDISVALEEYPGDTLVCVTISFNATLERYREMGYSEEELEALVDIIWQLFEDAGHQVYKNWMQYDKWICTIMTLDQIRTLDCGDNLALYLFFTGAHAY